MIEVLTQYFADLLRQKKHVMRHMIREFQRVYKAKNESIEYEKEMTVQLEKLCRKLSYYLAKGEQLEGILSRTFKAIEDIADVRQMTNAQLKQIIQKIEVDKEGNVGIYLRLFGELELDETILIEGSSDSYLDKLTKTGKIIPENHNHT